MGAEPTQARVADRSPADDRARLRVAVVGVSTDNPCGVHDHAALLAQALSRRGSACSLHWLWRGAGSLAASRRELSGWLRELAGELESGRPDVVLLHYSVFALSHRGLPLFVAPLLKTIERARVPVVTVLHEYAYPWRRGGARGALWAVSQRAVLRRVVRASDAVVVTADFRAAWLRSRRLLPAREVAFAPVFSNLPAASGAARPGSPASAEASPPAPAGQPAERPAVGLFGYSYEGAPQSLVLDAVGELHARGRPVELRLLGSPGRASAVGRRWEDGARARGIGHAISFSGRLDAQELADALASCELLLFADAPGPTSRKTTLAASLAAGRPVVALDGRHAWGELVRAEAAQIVAPTAPALSRAVAQLLADPELRERLGRRGRSFAESAMGLERAAGVVSGVLERAAGRRAATPDAPAAGQGR
jgi:glycosyltransferase involved in cell wall biosynthesis